MSSPETGIKIPAVVHLFRKQINAQKWNRCVAKAINETPLAYTWVLDHLTPGWEALVFGDYEGVMPLPVSRRLGMKIIQMPPEVLTLGILSDNEAIIRQFPAILHHPALSDFRFIGYNGSPRQDHKPSFHQETTKQIQILPLKKKYTKLFREYSQSHQRNIRLFQKKNGEIKTENSPATYLELIKKVGEKRPEIYLPKGYRNKFQNMIAETIDKNQGQLLSVYQNNLPVAVAFFLSGNKRTIVWHLATSEGYQLKASFALIDHFIQGHAETDKILDFAGSSLPRVAEFNRRFGAITETYPSVTINRLPPVVKVIKHMKVWHRLKRFFH